MTEKNIVITIPTSEKEFQYVCTVIDTHTASALAKVNEEHLLTCWDVGSIISSKLKAGNWGDKVVRELSAYIRHNRPDHRGFGKSNLYAMVRFYEAYSSKDFAEIVQSLTGQSIAFVQSQTGQMPSLLCLVTYTHHTIILNRCESLQERLWLYVDLSG